MGDILQLFEGPLFKTNASVTLTPPHKDVFLSIWSKADKALAEIYDNTNFAHILAEDLKLNTNHIMDYSI